jgi:hypothetical protein
MSRQIANRMIGAAKVALVLAPTGAIPRSEWITRPMTTLPKEKHVEAWNRAVTSPEEKGLIPGARSGLGRPIMIVERGSR